MFISGICACNPTEKQVPEVTGSTGSITITDGWARSASKGMNSAAYLTIFNGTSTSDTLLNIKAGASNTVSIHQSYNSENGMTGMRPAGTVIIQPDSNFILKPGGYHIMLMHLNKDLTKGDSLQLTFEFAISGKKTATIPVRLSN